MAPPSSSSSRRRPRPSTSASSGGVASRSDISFLDSSSDSEKGSGGNNSSSSSSEEEDEEDKDLLADPFSNGGKGRGSSHGDGVGAGGSRGARLRSHGRDRGAPPSSTSSRSPRLEPGAFDPAKRGGWSASARKRKKEKKVEKRDKARERELRRARNLPIPHTIVPGSTELGWVLHTLLDSELNSYLPSFQGIPASEIPRSVYLPVRICSSSEQAAGVFVEGGIRKVGEGEVAVQLIDYGKAGKGEYRIVREEEVVPFDHRGDGGDASRSSAGGGGRRGGWNIDSDGEESNSDEEGSDDGPRDPDGPSRRRWDPAKMKSYAFHRRCLAKNRKITAEPLTEGTLEAEVLYLDRVLERALGNQEGAEEAEEEEEEDGERRQATEVATKKDERRESIEAAIDLGDSDGSSSSGGGSSSDEEESPRKPSPPKKSRIRLPSPVERPAKPSGRNDRLSGSSGVAFGDLEVYESDGDRSGEEGEFEEEEPYTQDLGFAKQFLGIGGNGIGGGSGDSSDSDSDTDDTCGSLHLRPSSREGQTASEPLRAGDVILYYSPLYRWGDKRGKRIARVLAVRPVRSSGDREGTQDGAGGMGEDRSPLVLDNSEQLAGDVSVKRIKAINRRGTRLSDHPGVFREIRKFKLIEGGFDAGHGTSAAAGIRKEAERVGDIVRRNQEKMREKAKRDGFAPLDVLVDYGGGRKAGDGGGRAGSRDAGGRSPAGGPAGGSGSSRDRRGDGARNDDAGGRSGGGKPSSGTKKAIDLGEDSSTGESSSSSDDDDISGRGKGTEKPVRSRKDSPRPRPGTAGPSAPSAKSMSKRTSDTTTVAASGSDSDSSSDSDSDCSLTNPCRGAKDASPVEQEMPTQETPRFHETLSELATPAAAAAVQPAKAKAGSSSSSDSDSSDSDGSDVDLANPIRRANEEEEKAKKSSERSRRRCGGLDSDTERTPGSELVLDETPVPNGGGADGGRRLRSVGEATQGGAEALLLMNERGNGSTDSSDSSESEEEERDDRPRRPVGAETQAGLDALLLLQGGRDHARGSAATGGGRDRRRELPRSLKSDGGNKGPTSPVIDLAGSGSDTDSSTDGEDETPHSLSTVPSPSKKRKKGDKSRKSSAGSKSGSRAKEKKKARGSKKKMGSGRGSDTDSSTDGDDETPRQLSEKPSPHKKRKKSDKSHKSAGENAVKRKVKHRGSSKKKDKRGGLRPTQEAFQDTPESDSEGSLADFVNTPGKLKELEERKRLKKKQQKRQSHGGSAGRSSRKGSGWMSKENHDAQLRVPRPPSRPSPPSQSSSSSSSLGSSQPSVARAPGSERVGAKRAVTASGGRGSYARRPGSSRGGVPRPAPTRVVPGASIPGASLKSAIVLDGDDSDSDNSGDSVVETQTFVFHGSEDEGSQRREKSGRTSISVGDKCSSSAKKKTEAYKKNKRGRFSTGTRTKALGLDPSSSGKKRRKKRAETAEKESLHVAQNGVWHTSAHAKGRKSLISKGRDVPSLGFSSVAAD